MELPLTDYDQLPLTELRHRIRALDEPQLRLLFDHETARHGVASQTPTRGRP